MDMFDTITLDDSSMIRRTSDGYLVAAPRVARTGVQIYRGSEVGKPTMDTVRVFRPESAVFASDAMASLAYKPITDDHPPVQVTDKNWKKYAVGSAGGEIAKDGQFIRVPMMLMDGAAIKKVEAGKAELSVGYSCEIHWTPGEFNGEKYDAVQADIKANHIAVVDAARGGEKLRIGDAETTNSVGVSFDAYNSAVDWIAKGGINMTDALADGLPLAEVKDGSKGYPFGKQGTVYVSALRHNKADAAIAGDTDMVRACDALLKLVDTHGAKPPIERKTTMTDKTIMVDGISVITNDVGSQVIEKHIKQLGDSVSSLNKQMTDAAAKHTAELATRDTQIATLTTDGATKDAKIATLETQLKDGAMTPAKLDALVLERKGVADKAIAILGDKASVAGKTNTEIMKQVVDAKLGDKAKDWNEVQIAASFEALTADVKTTGVTDTARAFSTPPVQQVQDSAARYDARDKRLSDAWKGEAPAAKQ